jgi:hypothetical protein
MRSRVAVLVASLAAAPVSWPATVGAGSPQLRPAPSVPDVTSRTPGAVPIPTWDTFTADVTIRRRLVKKDGAVAAEAPEMRYRWVRHRTADGWKSTMTVLSAAPERVETSKGPQLVSRKIPISRIEIGDPKTPARVFDTEGRMVFLPATPPRSADATPSVDHHANAQVMTAEAAARELSRRLGNGAPTVSSALAGDASDAHSQAWIGHMLPGIAGRAERRAALAQRMGAPQGMIRGLERFVSTTGDTTTEILADPTWSVPVEINVARAGTLVSHSVLTYAQDPGAGLFRRRLQGELLVAPESGDRAQVDFELSNIRLGTGSER